MRSSAVVMLQPYEGLPLPILELEDVRPFKEAVSVVDLSVAAVDFSVEQ
jgi:hypothetical protein